MPARAFFAALQQCDSSEGLTHVPLAPLGLKPSLRVSAPDDAPRLEPITTNHNLHGADRAPPGLKEGDRVSLTNGLQATVSQVAANGDVTIDLNPELAGEREGAALCALTRCGALQQPAAAQHVFLIVWSHLTPPDHPSRMSCG